MPFFSLYPIGGSAHMAQYFRGNLAGLMIRLGKLDNKKVIDCLYTCKEGLDVQLPEEVANTVKVRGAGVKNQRSMFRGQCFTGWKVVLFVFLHLVGVVILKFSLSPCLFVSFSFSSLSVLLSCTCTGAV